MTAKNRDSEVPVSSIVCVSVLLPFILLCAACSGHSWSDRQELEVLNACRAATGGHEQLDSCCVDFVKNRMSGSAFDELDVVTHTDLIMQAHYQCTGEL